MSEKNKHFGVVEGFYRRPYSWEHRYDCIRFLSDIGCNTYVYGPKADPYHREQWHLHYPRAIMRAFRDAATLSREKGIRFNYALSPMARTDSTAIKTKIRSMMAVGIEHFSLFYDDIKVALDQATALAQTVTANDLYVFLKGNIPHPTLLFCPTQYRGFKDTEYIRTIADTLDSHIDIFWTGKFVVSPWITKHQIERITALYKRPPLIWDNLFANDYIPGTVHAFPYRYRAGAATCNTRGILINPMNQYARSKPLIYTAALFFRDSKHYVPRAAWREAIGKLSTDNIANRKHSRI
jgi:hyaluronoglucosaminidase